MQTTRTTLAATMLFSALILSVALSQNYANAQTVPASIPSWFHYKAMLWANGQISDQDFLNSIQTLVSGQNFANSSSSGNGMQGMSGMGNMSGMSNMSGINSVSDSLLSAMGQTIYCNDMQGMAYNPQVMSQMANCNTQAMSGMSGMSGMSSSGNNMQGTSSTPSNCVNTQSLPGQSSQCSYGPSLFDEIANNMIGMSSMFTFDAYTQGMMNGMSGTQSSMLSSPSALADLSGVLSSGVLSSSDYAKYFSSPARSVGQINIDVERHTNNCNTNDFPRVDWAFCNQSGSDLNHQHLSHADLVGTDLSGTNLYKSDLVQANLDFANFTNAQMENADFSSANMSGTQMIGTHMPYADLDFVTLNGANMTGADLKASQMRWATMERVSFNGANLDNALLMNTDLRGADFRGASLQGTGFADADLTGANFNGDDLRSVDLGSAILTGAQLHCINNPVCN
jgi:uncharacterized protein YjbI with pentapeptide repeats